MQSIDTSVARIARQSQRAAHTLATASNSSITTALRTMKRLLQQERGMLERANRKDICAARQRGVSAAMIDRLALSDTTLAGMTSGLQTLMELTSATGQISKRRTRPNGLTIYQQRVPIGVIGIIYESRPNVTVDAAAICLKSKNAVILRGGSEAIHSNTALAKLFSAALRTAGLPPHAVQLIPTTDRAAVSALLALPDSIDLIIPRGGEGLIRRVVRESQIPVIKHYKGVCHTFVSRHATMRQALPIIINAKVQRPGVCNAMETLLIDKGLSQEDRSAIVAALVENGVRLRGDPATRALNRAVERATAQDWEAEYLDLVLAVKTVNGLEEAITHINRYGSRHTDAILTRSKQEMNRFIAAVDSSSVMVNASTRFADGGEYGMGCEIGISTDKLHARGPMGCNDLTTYKWVVLGKGHIRT